MPLEPKNLEAGAKFIKNITSDCANQPKFREESARCEAYYDGRQLDPDLVERMKGRKQPIIINNLIKPTINGVLGTEAKTRTSWMVKADDKQGAEVAEGLNEKLHEAARLGKADRACADAYARQLKAGLGFVELLRNPDPFGSRYLLEEVNWREIYWDWDSKMPDWSDARWVKRRKWLDLDVALLIFPKHKALIQRLKNNGFATDLDPEAMELLSPNLLASHQIHQSYPYDEHSWHNASRDKAAVEQVWYRRYTTGSVIRIQDRVELYDPNNIEHLTLLAHGGVNLELTSFPVMWEAFFIGPHLIVDRKSKFIHNEFPIVPFWGYREGDTNIPYGLVRDMLSPQDEVNFRRSSLTWMLKNRRLVAERDAFDMTPQEVKREMNKPDGVLWLNKRKRDEGPGYKIESDSNIASQQFQVMQDAQTMIQDVGGIYSSYLGQEGGAQSGVAISSLVEQGSTTLSEINDNYRFARTKVGELLLGLIVLDIGKRPMTVTTRKENGQDEKHIYLNQQVYDDKTGRPIINNDVTLAKTHVVLDDIQSTAAYRTQLFERFSSILETLPDNLKLALLPHLIELSDMPKRKEVIKTIQQATGQGMDPSDMSDEQRKQYELAQQKKQQQEQVMQLMQNLEIQLKEAQVAKTRSEVQKNTQDAAHTDARTQEIFTRITGMEQDQEINQAQHGFNVRQNVEEQLAQLFNQPH